ncbi:NUDIX domain-containing protein [Allorhizobium undicola]|uniref:NUDIX domain-containing protein n=1 Tax=Allorhizobium undicola TaxID=78527 RepID=UPI00056B4D8F|nr:NUDIX domain-containing protein [Allorhizobium undicola]
MSDQTGRPGTDFPGLGVGLAILRNEKILLYKRRKAPEAGFWNIVGGKVDLFEGAEQAARREAVEESGLIIGTLEFVTVMEQIIPADGQHWISMIYKTSETEGEPRLAEPEKQYSAVRLSNAQRTLYHFKSAA